MHFEKRKGVNGTFPKLLGKIIEKYGTRREFAKAAGVSEGTICQMAI